MGLKAERSQTLSDVGGLSYHLHVVADAVPLLHCEINMRACRLIFHRVWSEAERFMQKIGAEETLFKRVSLAQMSAAASCSGACHPAQLWTSPIEQPLIELSTLNSPEWVLWADFSKCSRKAPLQSAM